MNPRSANFLLAGTTVVAVCALLQGGPLNPPTGPISSGGKTTQEIYDAVTGISGAIGSGGRSVAVPGASYTAGSFTMSTTPTATSGPIIGLRHGAAKPIQGTQPSGPLAQTSFTIVRELGLASSRTFRALSDNQIIATTTVSLPSAGGSTTFTLFSARVYGLRQYHIQRADGTYAAIEEIDLVATQVRVTDPQGAQWDHSYALP